MGKGHITKKKRTTRAEMEKQNCDLHEKTYTNASRALKLSGARATTMSSMAFSRASHPPCIHTTRLDISTISALS